MRNPAIQILTGQIQPGSIVLNETIPSLSIGRTLVVTVLSAPKAGRVLVSMFGKRLHVETTMPLHKGQVINLRVHALTPRIVLKPVDSGAASQSAGVRDLGGAVGGLVGSFGEKPVESFLFQEIFKNLFSQPGQDAAQSQIAAPLIEQILQYPQACAFLFIPLADYDSRGSAKVWAERDEDGYVLNFEIETDRLGSLECTARMDQGIDVEIRASSPETAEFLSRYVHELKESLQPFGVRYIRISHTTLKDRPSRGVDVLV